MTHLHLSLTATDLDASIAFYTALFDRSPDKRHADYARFTVADPPLVLALRPTAQARPAGHLDHLGLRLADPDVVRAAHRRLAAAGLVESTEEGVRCCYAVQDKVWLRDPDGHAWEVYTVLADADRLRPDRGGCCGEPAAADQGCCG